MRRRGAAAGDSFEGEWILEGRPDFISFNFHVQGDKLTGEIIERKVTHEPIVEGSVNADDITFKYLNRFKAPMLWTAKRVGDHLDMVSDLKRPLHAVRIAESATGFGGTPAKGEKP